MQWRVVGIIVVVGAVGGAFYWARQRAVAAAPGEPVNAWFVPRGSGQPVLVLQNEVAMAYRKGGTDAMTRLIAVDVATGATHTRAWGDTSVFCDVAGSGMLECDHVGPLDAVTLESRGKPSDYHGTPLPPATCGTARIATVAGTKLHVVGDEVGIDEPPPANIYARHDKLEPGTKTAPLAGKPRFLATPDRYEAFVTPSGVLAVRAPNDVWTLSLIGPDGAARWSTPLGGECQQAQLVGDTVVLAVKSASPRALAVDVATGAVRWRVPSASSAP